MAEEAVMKKRNRIIAAVKREFPRSLYERIRLTDPCCPFDLEIFRKDEEKGDEVFKIRVAVDAITDRDRTVCRDYKMCGKIFTKLVAYRPHGEKNVKYEKV